MQTHAHLGLALIYGRPTSQKNYNRSAAYSKQAAAAVPIVCVVQWDSGMYTMDLRFICTERSANSLANDVTTTPSSV